MSAHFKPVNFVILFPSTKPTLTWKLWSFTVFKMNIFHSTACSNFVLHFTVKFWFYILHSLEQSVSILKYNLIMFYILQAILFSNFTARTLVIFHSTFAKHINPPLWRWLWRTLDLCVSNTQFSIVTLSLGQERALQITEVIRFFFSFSS